MVAEAMRQAGIGKDEPVALIGHSQGGIVAATLASDWAEEYTIEHVVTAGSPVAPIIRFRNARGSPAWKSMMNWSPHWMVPPTRSPITGSPYKGMYRPRPRQHHPQCIRTAHALPAQRPSPV